MVAPQTCSLTHSVGQKEVAFRTYPYVDVEADVDPLFTLFFAAPFSPPFLKKDKEEEEEEKTPRACLGIWVV